MTPVTLENYLIVGAILFVLGMIGFLSRRNMILMFLSAEMMLQGVAINLVAFAHYRGNLQGQVFVLFMLTVAELGGGAPLPSAEELSFRRERWLGYHEVQVPPTWQGVPEPEPLPEIAEEETVLLSGIGANDGAIEGTVRVVTDAAADKPEASFIPPDQNRYLKLN